MLVHDLCLISPSLTSDSRSMFINGRKDPSKKPTVWDETLGQCDLPFAYDSWHRKPSGSASTVLDLMFEPLANELYKRQMKQVGMIINT